jgi:hypothetical protein
VVPTWAEDGMRKKNRADVIKKNSFNFNLCGTCIPYLELKIIAVQVKTIPKTGEIDFAMKKLLC